MPLILPGNVGSTTTATGYDVANSVRFDTNAYMHKTPGSAGSLTTWTFSTWIKRSKLGATQYIFTSKNDGNNQTFAYFNSDDTIIFFDIDGGSDQGKLITNRKFRDVGAWYNLTFIWNTTSGTAGDRIQLWVNGVRETSFATQTNPDQNDASTMGDAHIIEVGRGGEDSNYANYYMAETVYQNNSATTPVDKFGEYDSDSGIWKPKNVSGLTAGTNGFYLDFEDSSNLGNDAFGGTDLTEVNLAATDQSTDTCTNNFCTLNSLVPTGGGFSNNSSTFTEGNLAFATNNSSNSWGYALGTFGVASGKWYWEVKVTTLGSGEMIGIAANNSPGTNQYPGKDGNSYGYNYTGYLGGPDEAENSYGNSYGANDIIGVLLNLDDNELKFSKNGTIQNSGTAKAITAPASTDKGFYFPAYAVANNSGNGAASFNFGSPPYAISSGNTDGDGYGNFEYAVPSGYFSLCTKNLAEYG